MVKTELSRIIIDEKKHEQLIVLKEQSGSRLLPIVVGLNEAVSIRMYLNAANPPRPFTHDLIKNIIESLRAVLERVVIDKLVDNTFHAKLYLKIYDGTMVVVDARPSDGVALAVRFSVPVFVEEAVFEKLSRRA